MRQLFTVAFLLLSSTSFSQSALFVGIGHDTSEVREDLDSRGYFRSITEDSLNLWVANIYPHQEVRFHFHDGILFAIEDSRVFEDKEQAEQVMSSCVNYLKMVDYDTKELDSGGNDVDHYVAITHDRVVEFRMVRNRETEAYTCSLMVTSRRYGPRMKTESFVAQVNAF